MTASLSKNRPISTNRETACGRRRAALFYRLSLPRLRSRNREANHHLISALLAEITRPHACRAALAVACALAVAAKIIYCVIAAARPTRASHIARGRHQFRGIAMTSCGTFFLVTRCNAAGRPTSNWLEYLEALWLFAMAAKCQNDLL